MKARLWVMACWGGFALAVGAPEDPKTNPAPAPKIRYQKGQEIDFEKLLIQGQIERPMISVVTADNDQSTDGLLRLRNDFLDKMAADAGEIIP